MGSLQQFGVFPGKGGGQVAQEHQTKADVLVVRGRDGSTHLVGGIPKPSFKCLALSLGDGFLLGWHKTS